MNRIIKKVLMVVCALFFTLSVSVANTYSDEKPLHLSKSEILAAIEAFDQTKARARLGGETSLDAYSDARQGLLELIEQRKQLLIDAPSRERSHLLGFGPEGVRNMQLEWKWLRSLSTHLELYRGWNQFVKDVQLSPMAVVSAVFQFSVALVLLSLWRSRVVSRIKTVAESKRVSRKEPFARLLQSTSQHYLRVHNFVEYWLLLSFTLGLISELWSFIDLAPVQSVFNWLLWGLAVIQLIDSLSAARHRRWQRQDSQAKLRLKSVKLIGYVVIIAGLLLALIEDFGAGGGTLAAWIRVGFFWAVIPVFILILRWWRPVVAKHMSAAEYEDRVIPAWVCAHATGLISFIAVIVGGGYLLLTLFAKQVLQVAGEREMVRSAMAYLFRVEVARQSAKDQKQNQLEPIDVDNITAFALGYETSEWVASVSELELERVAKSCISDKSTINVIFADRGRGKTSFLKRLDQEIVGEVRVVSMQTPAGADFASLLDVFGDQLGMDDDAGARDVAAALKNTDPMVIMIDDVHRMIKPSIGGLKELERLVRFIRRSSQNISWVMAVESSSWQFVARARGERFLFDLEIELPRWHEAQIAELIEIRTKASGLEVSYEGMVVPRQLDVLDQSDDEQVARGYARILWEYSKGNPGVALYLWSQSLFIGEQGEVLVRLFEIPDTTGLDGLSVTLLLVLRAILQLELAAKMDVAKATNLTGDEVIDALRLLTSKGYIVRHEDNFYTIFWPWYRAVTTVLNRQHLVIL
jgi:hypothetical protein